MFFQRRTAETLSRYATVFRSFIFCFFFCFFFFFLGKGAPLRAKPRIRVWSIEGHLISRLVLLRSTALRMRTMTQFLINVQQNSSGKKQNSV